MFLAELNFEVSLLNIGMLLLDLLNPFRKARLQNALVTINRSDHDGTFNLSPMHHNGYRKSIVMTLGDRSGAVIPTERWIRN